MIEQDFKIIMEYAHYWHWLPDWEIAVEIYEKIPDSYSVLTPFAYSYLEELIRSTTSDYGLILPNPDKTVDRHFVGKRLLELAKEENREKHPEYVLLLETKIEHYFSRSSHFCEGDNRNSVVHGYFHPNVWTKESFETLIHDIASLSKFARF